MNEATGLVCRRESEIKNNLYGGKKCTIDYGMKLITKSEYLTKLEYMGESSVQIGWSK